MKVWGSEGKYRTDSYRIRYFEKVRGKVGMIFTVFCIVGEVLGSFWKCGKFSYIV